MADVGVLNLQIQADASKASSSLRELAGALAAVKEAVGKGLSLGSLPTQLKNLRTALSGDWSGSKTFKDSMVRVKEGIQALSGFGAAGKVTGITDALKTLNGIGNVGNNMKNIADGLRSIAGTTKNAEALASAIRIDASALSRMKSVCEGFTIPNFNNLIRLAESMQANPMSSVVMSRMAESMNALKAASDGFRMPRMAGLDRAIASMQNSEVVSENAVDSIGQIGNVAVEDAAAGIGQIGIAAEDMAVELERVDRAVNQIADDAAQLLSGDTQPQPVATAPILGDNSGPEEFLSTWADAGEQWEQNMAVNASEAAQEIRDQMNSVTIGEGAVSGTEPVEHAADNVVDATQRIINSQYAEQAAIQATQHEMMQLMSIMNQWPSMSDAMKQFTRNNFADNPRMSAFIDQMDEIVAASQRAQNAVTDMNTTMQTAGTEQQVQNVPTVDTTSLEQAISQVDTLVNSMSSDQAQIATAAYDIENRINELAATEAQLRMELAQDIQAQGQDAAAIGERAAQIRMLEQEQLQLYAQLMEMEHASRTSTRALNALRDAFHGLREGMHNLPFARLLSQMARMAKMRALRYAIRELAKGFREGVENMYHYSELIGGGFANDMDEAATALNQMKNSIGAAAAPVIQMLIPALKSVVNWIIEVVNYLNQFFALLSGNNTWTKALAPSEEAFEDQKENVKETAKAVKDMLADFDELNIIQQQNSGGTGGGTNGITENYEEMFTEVDAFDSRIVGLVQWIEDHMETIKGIAIAVGAAILGWKISRAFGGVLSTLGQLITGLATVAIGLQLEYLGAYEAGLTGEFNATSFLETAAGGLMSIIGGAIVGFKFGGVTGALIGGTIGLVVAGAVAIKGYYDGQLQKKVNDKWGKLHLTDEQVKELVDTQITARAIARIQITNAVIDKIHNARAAANHAIEEFGTSLQLARFALGTDTSKNAMDAALESAKEAIGQIQTWLTESKEGLSLSFTHFTYKDKQGKDITSELYSSLTAGDNALNEYFTGLGDDIAYYISKGFTDGLSEEEQKMALELMTTFDNIVNEAENSYNKRKMVREMAGTMDNYDNLYDAATAEKIYNEQMKRVQEYKDTTINELETSLDSYDRRISYWESLKKHYEEKGNTEGVQDMENAINAANMAMEDIEKRLEMIRNGTYNWEAEDETYKEMMDALKQTWINHLKDSYFEMYGNELLNTALNGYDGEIYENLEDAVVASVGKFYEYFGFDTPENPITKIFSQFGITFKDLLTDEQKKQLGQKMLEAVQFSNNKQEIFLEDNVEDAITKYVLDLFNLDMPESQPKTDKETVAELLLDNLGLAYSELGEYIEDPYGLNELKDTGEFDERIKDLMFNNLIANYSDPESLEHGFKQIADRYGKNDFERVYDESYNEIVGIYNDMWNNIFDMSEEDFKAKYADHPKMADALLQYYNWAQEKAQSIIEDAMGTDMTEAKLKELYPGYESFVDALIKRYSWFTSPEEVIPETETAKTVVPEEVTVNAESVTLPEDVTVNTESVTLPEAVTVNAESVTLPEDVELNAEKVDIPDQDDVVKKLLLAYFENNTQGFGERFGKIKEEVGEETYDSAYSQYREILDKILYGQNIGEMTASEFKEMFESGQILQGIDADVIDAFIESYGSRFKAENAEISASDAYINSQNIILPDTVSEEGFDPFGEAPIFKDMLDTITNNAMTKDEFMQMYDYVEPAMLNEFVQKYLDLFTDGAEGFNGKNVPYGMLASAAYGMPYGQIPVRSMTSVDQAWEENETNERAADASEGTKAACDAQNQKLDTQNGQISILTNILRAVLSKLNSGLNVNMTPDSSAGRTVGSAMAAFAEVTGDYA